MVSGDAEDGRRYINKISDAGDAAKDAGDQAALNAADEALRRIAHGERPDVVYLEWLRAQGARDGGS